VTPAIFLLLNTWILIYVFIDKPTESLVGLGIVAVGAALYGVSVWFGMATPEVPEVTADAAEEAEA
jgi:hypothetical protein